MGRGIVGRGGKSTVEGRLVDPDSSASISSGGDEMVCISFGVEFDMESRDTFGLSFYNSFWLRLSKTTRVSVGVYMQGRRGQGRISDDPSKMKGNFTRST